jgi:SP family sugar:H+ symporter-like MFS transporter
VSTFSSRESNLTRSARPLTPHSYGVQFAQTAGLDDSYVFLIILASVNVAMSFPAMYSIDRFGRRPVLLVGGFIMFAAQLIVGAVAISYPNNQVAGKVLIAFTCFFIAA